MYRSIHSVVSSLKREKKRNDIPVKYLNMICREFENTLTKSPLEKTGLKMSLKSEPGIVASKTDEQREQKSAA